MSKIIISGKTGFVAQSLIPYLTDYGFKIVGVSRKPLNHKLTISYEELNTDVINKS